MKMELNWLVMQQPDAMYSIVENMKKRIAEGHTEQRPGLHINDKSAPFRAVDWAEVKRFTNIHKYWHWNLLQSLLSQHLEFSANQIASWDKACREQSRRLTEAVSGVHGNVAISPQAAEEIVVVRSLTMLVTCCNLQDVFVTRYTQRSVVCV